MKALQIFTPEYLKESRKMTTEQVLEFLESFRKLAAAGVKTPTRLISLRVEEALLSSFKQKARLEGVRYQTKIKELMRKYVEGE
jgi:predicted DNA binding CopG/RHH family protein